MENRRGNNEAKPNPSRRRHRRHSATPQPFTQAVEEITRLYCALQDRAHRLLVWQQLRALLRAQHTTDKDFEEERSPRTTDADQPD